jgi:hypothetical protein
LPALSPLEGTWVGTLSQADGNTFAVTIKLHMEGNNASGTWRGATSDDKNFVVRNFVGTFLDGTLHIKGTTTVDATTGLSWCPPETLENVLTLSGNQLDGAETGCGPGTLHLKKS